MNDTYASDTTKATQCVATQGVAVQRGPKGDGVAIKQCEVTISRGEAGRKGVPVLLVADVRVGLLLRRVESEANLADGPTRGNLKCLNKLNAEWHALVLPEWVFDLWRYDGHAVDLCVRAEV